MGAEPVVVDVFDAEALARAVLEAKPEIVIHQLTDLADVRDPAKRPAALLRNARIRDQGTRNLVAAARQAGARRLIAQSIAWVYAPGPKPYCEDHPLDLSADGLQGMTVQGVASLERQVLEAPPMEGSCCATAGFTAPGAKSTRPRPGRRFMSTRQPMLRFARSTMARRARSISPTPATRSRCENAVAELGWRADFRIGAS